MTVELLHRDQHLHHRRTSCEGKKTNGACPVESLLNGRFVQRQDLASGSVAEC